MTWLAINRSERPTDRREARCCASATRVPLVLQQAQSDARCRPVDITDADQSMLLDVRSITYTILCRTTLIANWYDQEPTKVS